MLSIYIVTSPVVIFCQNKVSIIVWNMAGELVSPKNITVGSNSPLFVLNVAFHWLPSLMCTLFYPHSMSNLVNHCLFTRLAISSLMSKRG
jgi:hypothetical protein